MNTKTFFRNWRRWLAFSLPLLLLALGVLGFSLASTPEGQPVRDFFLTPDNARFMAAQGIAVALGTLGMALVLLCGGIDLSAGAAAALSGVVVATLLQNGAPTLAAVGAALLTGAALGALNGALVGTLRIAPFVVTLGTFGMARGAAHWIAGKETVLVPAGSGMGDALRGLRIAPGIWVVLLLAAGLAVLLRATVFGRHLRAIGSNEEAATLCGVRVRLTKGLVYTVAGLFFALAGIASMAVTGEASAAGGVGVVIAFLAAAMIGGVKLGGGAGGVFGALLGALAITVLQNGAQQAGWPVPLQEIGMGGLLVAAVGLDRLRHGN